MTTINYKPPPTIEKYLTSTAPVAIVHGPIGSGKTSGSIMKIQYHAARQRPSQDGLRKSRWCVVRNTSQQLHDTTIKSWLSWFPHGSIGFYKESYRTFTICYADVYAEVLFRPLDRPEDIGRLLSLDLTGLYLNEAREIPYEILTSGKGRCGRYPPKEEVQPYEFENDPIRSIEDIQDHSGGKIIRFASGRVVEKHLDGLWLEDYSDWTGVMADTNMPDHNSWLHKLVESPHELMDEADIPQNWDYFFQPAGDSPEAENTQYLKANYYQDLKKGATREWINVYIKCKYGTGKGGMPVYRDTFNYEFHTADNLKHNPLLPIGIGLDLGRTPSAILKQREPNGRIITLREVIGENIGLSNFLNERLKPILNTHYLNVPVFICPDPSGAAGSQARDDESLHQIIKDAGFEIVVPYSNIPNIRINEVEKALGRTTAGKSMYLIDRTLCPVLIEGFQRGYQYRQRRDGSHEDKPDKVGPGAKYSHPHDANQYIDMMINQLHVGGRMYDQGQRREVKVASLAGWT